MRLKTLLHSAGMGSVLLPTLVQCWPATKLFSGLTIQHRLVWIITLCTVYVISCDMPCLLGIYSTGVVKLRDLIRLLLKLCT